MKSLKITEKTHNLLKLYCNENSLKMNLFVENLIKNKIENDKRKESRS